MSLITLQQAADHLGIDLSGVSPPDAIERVLVLQMAAAEHIVLDYLKVISVSPPLWTDENDVPPLVSAAILLQLGELYRFRGDDDRGGPEQTTGDLSPIVTNILRRYRDPAVA